MGAGWFWPLHVWCRRKTFTFAISSFDELLYKQFVVLDHVNVLQKST